jgi:hypothetical protein
MDITAVGCAGYAEEFTAKAGYDTECTHNLGILFHLTAISNTQSYAN